MAKKEHVEALGDSAGGKDSGTPVPPPQVSQAVAVPAPLKAVALPSKAVQPYHMGLVEEAANTIANLKAKDSQDLVIKLIENPLAFRVLVRNVETAKR